MAIYVFGDPQDEGLAKFAYDSLVNDGISRFFWSYNEGIDLNVLTSKKWEELTPEEYEARKKSEFLLGIKPGDYVVHVNLPTWGKVTVCKVVLGYYFQRDLPEGHNDGRHCLQVNNVFTFDRDDPLVHHEISTRLKLKGSHWKILDEYEKEFFDSLSSLVLSQLDILRKIMWGR